MKKLVIAALAAAAVATPALAETYAIRAGRLITDAAKPARGASTIIIENGRIKAIEVGPGGRDGDRSVDDDRPARPHRCPCSSYR